MTRSSLTLVAALMAIPSVAHSQCARVEDGKLPPSDGTVDDDFGTALDIEGPIAVVGSPYADALGADSGQVTVFGDTGAGWIQTRQLVPPDGRPEDHFGFCLCLSGDLLIVGSPNASGNEDFSGTASIFRRSAQGWAWEQTLRTSPEIEQGHFGWAVAIEGDWALVGSEEEELVWVFRFDGQSWNETQQLDGGDGDTDAFFGNAIALDGAVAVIGAPRAGTGSYGAIHVFRRFDALWVKELFYRGLTQGDDLGIDVDVQGDLILAGAPGFEEDDDGEGAAVVFRFDGSTWQDEQYLVPLTHGQQDHTGISVKLDGGLAVLGAEWRDVGNSQHAGGAVVFRDDATHWVRVADLIPSDPAEDDELGYDVGISGNTVLVGSPRDNDLGRDSGSVRRYELPRLPLSAPARVQEGDPISIRSCGGHPGGLCLLAAVELNGAPTFLRIALGVFDGSGQFALEGGVPPGLTGLSVTLQAIGFVHAGMFVESERAPVEVQ